MYVFQATHAEYERFYICFVEGSKTCKSARDVELQCSSYSPCPLALSFTLWFIEKFL